ncbi:MAG: Ig-like domain-containing protein, partial [Candidatus Hydrogenedentota bacterium]
MIPRTTLDTGKPFDVANEAAPTEVPASPQVELPEAQEETGGETLSNISKAATLSTNFAGPFKRVAIVADISATVGPNHLLTTLNDDITIQDKVGTQLSKFSLVSFFNGLPGITDVFDPRCVYDHTVDRFYIAACVQRISTKSGIVLAVSATNNPLGPWHKWHFIADQDGTINEWADYPYLGFSNDKITASSNMFSISNNAFTGNEVFVFDKSTALDGGAITTNQFSQTNVAGMAPAITYDNTNTQFIVQRFFGDFGGGGLLQVFSITGSPFAPVLTPLSPKPSSLPWNTLNPAAPQSGTANKVLTNDDRLGNVVLRNGSLWTAACVGMPSGTTTTPARTAIRWWQINSTTLVTTQTGLVQDTTNTFYYYFPSITVNANNEVMLGFSGSSASTFISAMFAYRGPTTPVNTMEAPAVIKAGEGAWTQATRRWGDYTMTVTDPSDGLTMWTLQEYAKTGGGNWGTWWGRIGGGTGDTAPPTVASATALNPTTIRITFSEPMADNADLINPTFYTFSVSGGGVSINAISVARVNSTQVDVTTNVMTAGATYSAFVSTASPTDLAGNHVNPASNTTPFTGNTALPTPTLASIAGVAGGPTNVTPIPVTVTFSVPVVGFDLTDVSISANATKSNFVSVDGATYTFSLTPTSEGQVTAQIAASAATDAGNNQSVASSVFSRTFDSTAPTATMGSNASDPTGSSPIPVTVTFSENMTGFTSTDVIATSATVANFTTVSASTYTFNLSSPVNGLVTASIAGGVATDLAGNANSAATQFGRTFDGVKPTAALASTAPTNTNVSPIPVTFTFSESVTGFAVGDITLGNATASGFSGSGTSYSVSLTPSGQGPVTASVTANSAQDSAANGNNASSTLTRTFDTVAPIPVMSSVSSSPTSTTPITLNINFAENATGFATGDVVVAGATKGTFSGSDAAFSLILTPTGEGTVTANIAAAKLTDPAGNQNTAAAPFSISFDNSQPGVTITSSAANPTSTSPIPVSFTFSESVTGFTATDISVGNGAKGALTGSGASYSMNVTPTAPGAVTVDVPANGAQDGAGNQNTAATQFSINFDDAVPTVTLSSGTGANTNNSPIPVTATFSKAVFGFTAGDVTFTNASVSGFIGTGGDLVYTFEVTPTAEGTVTVSVPAGAAQDASANNNQASNVLNRTYDATQPGVSMASVSSDPTSTSPIALTIAFTEAVTGFVVGDISVTGATSSGFSGSGANYSVNLTPTGQGAVTASIAGGVAQDGASNGNTAATQFSRMFDSAAPSVVLSTTATNPTGISPIPVTATFNEDVTGFALADVAVTNATKGNLVAVTAKVYTFNLTPSAQGSVTASVGASTSQDGAGNQNTASNALNVTFDDQAPTVTMSSAAASTTSSSPIAVTIAFNESVSGFVNGDIVVSNATKSGFSGSGANYSVTLTPSGQGLVTADIAANTATDGAGNNNLAAPQFSRTFDSVAPGLTTSSAEPNPTSATPFAVSIDFTEPVTGFVNADIAVVNGSKSGFAGSGASYSVNITPTAPGLVTVDVAGSTALDGGNNGNAAAAQFSRTFDNSSPTLTLTSSASPGPTSTSPIPMTATLSEPVNGFTAADIDPVNAAVNNFTGLDGDAVYTFSLIPSGQGAVSAQVAAAAATDLTGNSSAQSLLFSITFDNVKPTVSLSSAAGNPANASPVPVTVTFSEAVTGFALVDVSTTGGTAGALTGSGASYTFSLTPTGQGSVSATVVANGAADSAGNTNTVSSAFARIFDSVAPTASISSTQASPTMNGSIPISVTFSESVTEFVVGDVAVTNGTKSGFTGSGASYSLTVTPTAQGVVTVNVAGATALDTASNNNSASTQFSVTFDSVQPGVSMSSAATDPANATPISVSVAFTESVTGFTSGDVVVTNAVLGGFAGSGASYSFNLTPSGQGLVTASIGAGLAQDGAGNTNTAAVQFSRTFDNVQPSVAISSSLTSPTSTSPVPITFTFSESVSGFANSDVTVTNGTKTGFAGSGASYSVTVTPTAEGLVTVNVGAGLAQDVALNTNTAATQFSITFDGSAPTPVLSSAAPTVTNTTPIPVTVEFGESVSGFGLSAVEVTNATKGNFAGSASTYTFDLTPIGQGAVTASIPAGSATDASGNTNNASTIFSRTFDSTQPTVALTTSAANPTNASPIPLTITFSESVTGFVIGDVVVTNATKSGFAGSGASYSVNVVPSGQGAVTVTVNGSAAQDSAGNNNTAGNVINRTFDTTQPGVSMASTASPGPTNVSPIPVTVTFTESVTGFVQADVTATNATISGFAGSGASYSFGLVPTTANGTVTASIAASVAQDGAGNNNTAATQFSIDFNSTNPTVVMTSATAVVTNTTPIPVTVTFSETVTGFTSGDITPSNGTVGGFSGSGASYSFNLTPTGQGAVTANIAGGIAQDAGTNPNDPAPQFSRTFDTAAPTVSMASTASPGPTKTTPIPVTVTFNESVTGFAVGDIAAGNATAGGFSGSGASYSFNLTPTGQGTVTANIAGSIAQDTAGNNNTAASQFSIVFDSAAPTVAITSSATSPTSTAPIPFTATFSEAVTGFAQGDITASNGTVGTFAVTNASTYTFTVSPTVDGTVTVDIPGGVAQDLAANGNQAASQFAITSDGTGPAATLSSVASNPTNSSPLTVLLTFSEAVTGLTLGEIVASGATVGSLSGSGASYSIQLTNLAAGTVTVDVAGGVAQDAAGNNNTAAAQFSRVFDGTKPSVSMTSASSNPTKTSPISVTANFTESVTGFVAGDISVTNGNVTNFTPNSGTQYVFNVIPSADGLVTVNISGGVAQDSAGNTNNAATALSRTFDATAPTVSMSSAAANPTNSNPIAVTVTFSESISGFALVDIVVGNGTASALSPAGGTGSSFTFNIAPTAPGAVTANIAAGVVV